MDLYLFTNLPRHGQERFVIGYPIRWSDLGYVLITVGVMVFDSGASDFQFDVICQKAGARKQRYSGGPQGQRPSISASEHRWRWPLYISHHWWARLLFSPSIAANSPFFLFPFPFPFLLHTNNSSLAHYILWWSHLMLPPSSLQLEFVSTVQWLEAKVHEEICCWYETECKSLRSSDEFKWRSSGAVAIISVILVSECYTLTTTWNLEFESSMGPALQDARLSSLLLHL